MIGGHAKLRMLFLNLHIVEIGVPRQFIAQPYPLIVDTEADDDMTAAKEGIKKVREFFLLLGMPSTLSEVGIDDSKFEFMAKEAIRTSGLSTRAYVKLDENDVMEIFKKCL